jgi:hypothetical protein
VILTKFPTAIEFYEIYIKSLLELGKDFVPTGISSFIDEIMCH